MSTPDSLSTNIQKSLDTLLGDERVRNALVLLERDASRTLEEQKALTRIPAPPFKEQARAQFFLERLVEAGLTDAGFDAEGNVIGRRRGSGGPTLVLSAHVDTVFPEEID